MVLLGKLDNGVYLDDCAGVHPDIIADRYGVHGAVLQRANGETGAGRLDDEDVPRLAENLVLEEEDWEDMIDEVGEANQHQFHHDPVAVPKHHNPFSDEDFPIFESALAEANRLQVVPPGYGIQQDEWENDRYPAFEILRSGRKGTKELRVALPDSVWRPRAELWVRALAILDQLTDDLECESE
jgi:hypothetical protein